MDTTADKASKFVRSRRMHLRTETKPNSNSGAFRTALPKLFSAMEGNNARWDCDRIVAYRYSRRAQYKCQTNCQPVATQTDNAGRHLRARQKWKIVAANAAHVDLLESPGTVKSRKNAIPIHAEECCRADFPMHKTPTRPKASAPTSGRVVTAQNPTSGLKAIMALPARRRLKVKGT